jgi:phosphate/sulfate permease
VRPAGRHHLEPDHLVEGLPSSSSHALIGGLCGAGLAAAHNNWDALIWSERLGSWAQNKGLLWKVFVPMITSPIAGFLLGIVVMVLLWALIAGLAKIGGAIGRLARPRIVNVLRQGADRLGGLHGLRPRPQRCAEDHGHHRHDPDRCRSHRRTGRPAVVAGLHAPGRACR